MVIIKVLKSGVAVHDRNTLHSTASNVLMISANLDFLETLLSLFVVISPTCRYHYVNIKLGKKYRRNSI